MKRGESAPELTVGAKHVLHHEPRVDKRSHNQKAVAVLHGQHTVNLLDELHLLLKARALAARISGRTAVRRTRDDGEGQVDFEQVLVDTHAFCDHEEGMAKMSETRCIRAQRGQRGAYMGFHSRADAFLNE